MQDVRPLLLLSRAISATHGVDVKFAPVQTARCIYQDGKHTIELPISDKDNANVLYRGYIDHEVGHVRFTDFTLSAGDAIQKALANVFEDEFVERKMGQLYPGSKINLRDLGRSIFNEAHVQKILARQDPMQNLFAFALYHRRAMLDGELGKWNDAIDAAMLSCVSQETLDKMLAKIQEPSAGTADNVRLARELLDLFRQEQDSQDKNDQQGENDQQDKNDSQDSQDSQDSHGDFSDFSVSERVSAELDGKQKENLTPLEQQLTEEGEFANPDWMTCPDTPRDEQILSALQRRLPSLLQSQRMVHCAIGKRGKLMGSRLARAAALDPRVFRTKARKEVQELEVGLLCDYSGSMLGTSRKLDKAVYATLLMLRNLPKVRSFAYGFGGMYYKKLWDGRKFDAMSPAGTTPLGPAMLRIAKEFTDTGRRILLVTTDGRPDAGVGPTKEICESLYRLGIEIYGIGIGRTALFLPGLFGEDKSFVVDSIAEYPAKLEAVLRKAML